MKRYFLLKQSWFRKCIVGITILNSAFGWIYLSNGKTIRRLP